MSISITYLTSFHTDFLFYDSNFTGLVEFVFIDRVGAYL